MNRVHWKLRSKHRDPKHPLTTLVLLYPQSHAMLFCRHQSTKPLSNQYHLTSNTTHPLTSATGRRHGNQYRKWIPPQNTHCLLSLCRGPFGGQKHQEFPSCCLYCHGRHADARSNFSFDKVHQNNNNKSKNDGWDGMNTIPTAG